MTNFLILLVVVGGAAWYFMTGAEMDQVRKIALAALHFAKDAVTLQGLPSDTYINTLRSRSRRVVVAPSLIALSVAASFASWIAPSNGRGWEHLATSIFAHAGVLDVFVNSVCLLQISLILERLVGRATFATVYIAAGAVASIASFALTPDGAHAGATGSVLGMYGLLLVTSAWTTLHPSKLSIPLDVAKRLGPVAAVFVFYHLTMSGLETAAAMMALASGVVAGMLMVRDVQHGAPPIRRIAAAMTAVVAIAIVYAVVFMRNPMSAITDVRPEIDRVIAVEHRTAVIYDEAVDRFRRGRMNTVALAGLIQQNIMPELEAVIVRLNALHDVPPEHQLVVATAAEYLKLRDESWQLRAEALLEGDPSTLRQADRKEQLSLAAFNRVKTPDRTD